MNSIYYIVEPLSLCELIYQGFDCTLSKNICSILSYGDYKGRVLVNLESMCIERLACDCDEGLIAQIYKVIPNFNIYHEDDFEEYLIASNHQKALEELEDKSREYRDHFTSL